MSKIMQQTALNSNDACIDGAVVFEQSEAVAAKCHASSATKIALGHGFFALIDTADLPLVGKRAWCLWKNPRHHLYYAQSSAGSMHRLIMGLGEGDPRTVDHRDGNGLNNRRDNLRVATQSQNRTNSRKFAATASRYKGVTSGPGGKWRAFVGTRGNRKYLGLFDNEIDGAKAYDTAALALFGEFACINFPTNQKAA